MALHDFRCPACGADRVDVNIPISIGAREAEVRCRCGCAMDWVPQVGRMDALEPFHKFSLDANGRTYEIGSLHDIRKAEQESASRARNGEGQPLVWRDYAQDRSNADRHTLAKRMDRSMDTQDGFAGGVGEIDKAKVGVARGAEVVKRQGSV